MSAEIPALIRTRFRIDETKEGHRQLIESGCVIFPRTETKLIRQGPEAAQ